MEIAHVERQVWAVVVLIGLEVLPVEESFITAAGGDDCRFQAALDVRYWCREGGSKHARKMLTPLATWDVLGPGHVHQWKFGRDDETTKEWMAQMSISDGIDLWVGNGSDRFVIHKAEMGLYELRWESRYWTRGSLRIY